MVEAIKFPGTDLDIFEKYPNSWRLDHPDFGDVRKTTFAKGVITDFEKISDDPIAVKSRVKVQVEGQGESGFIPFFFHPKPVYWDDPDHKATDFNQDAGFFEKAWMSFRGGDEVVVLLQEGVPKVVLGFVDGVPRIGEDLIHIDSVGHKCEVQMTAHDGGGLGDLYGGDWDLNMKGPDGKDLKLVTQIQPQFIEQLPDIKYSFWSGTNGGWGESGDFSQYVGGSADWCEWIGYYWRTTYTLQPKLYALLIPVGPILYSVRYIVMHITMITELLINQGTGTESTVLSGIPPSYHGYDPPDIGGGSWSVGNWATERARTSFPSSVCTFVYDDSTPDGTNYYFGYATLKSNGRQTSLGIAQTITSPNHEQNTTDDWIAQNNYNPYDINPPASLTPVFNVGAAIYRKDLTDPMSADFIKQTILDSGQNFLNILSRWIGSGNDPISDIESMKVLVRPHTKAELEAASMWPGAPA